MLNNELCILAQTFLKLNILYTFGVYLAGFVLRFIALFNTKIKLGVEGRSNTFTILESELSKTDKILWFHCASLGEYEQGLPVFNALRQHYSTHKVILSFFSPSGYEIRKNSPVADVVIYLPLDTPSNAKRFLDIVNPELTVFVKYDIWPNVLKELKKRQLKAILISAAYRDNQSFFKWYGKQTREALFAFDHIFTQNEHSKTLLERIHYTNTTVSGDTRFDRVTNQLQQNNTLPFVETFKQDHLCVVVGSSWPEDEKLLVDYINTKALTSTKFIIAPHNIKANQISNLKESMNTSCILFSEKEGKDLSDYQVLILDTIGLLTKVYNYADIAYIGGAMGTTGLHNTLEAAVFGVPIIIGSNHEKFPEAQAMIDNNGMLSVTNQAELNNALNIFVSNTEKRLSFGKQNELYIKKNEGAVVQILNFLRI
jgi:3-deoxy-D-manno-octulosonic-acid transferase